MPVVPEYHISFCLHGFYFTMAHRLFLNTEAMQVGEVMDEGTPGDKHLRKIAMHVSAYIAHVRTQLKQTIPKTIVHCLVPQQKLSSVSRVVSQSTF